MAKLAPPKAPQKAEKATIFRKTAKFFKKSPTLGSLMKG
jgi:hypothetical protein